MSIDTEALTAVIQTPMVAAMVAAGSPWARPVQALAAAVSGPIAQGFALIATVLGFLEWQYGEGGMRTFGKLVFGVGGALMAAQILTWLFPV